MKKILPLLLLLLSFDLYSQSYSELFNTGLENKSLGSVATGDLNNDGYLDLITTGINESWELSTSIYINDKDGSFTKLDVSLTPMYNTTIALGDYNQDGFLDILLAGEGYDPLSSLWKNNGDLTFTEVNVGLADLGGTNAEFRDIDNDGDLDILLSGSIRNQDGSYSSDLRLYSNEGNDTFEEFDLSFTSYAVVGSLGDFDNDGDLDLIIGGGSLEIYPNNGDGSFSSPMNYGSFPAGKIEWFDFNNDGSLDFIVSGRGFSVDEYFTKIYENVGIENNWFSEVENIDFTNPRRGNLDIRDYNSDGFLDLLITGTLDFSNNSFVTRIYDNSETTFTENLNVNLPQLGSGDGKWFDIDNDGDLDLILTGEEVQGSNVKKTVVYQNDANDNIYSANSIPNAPVDLNWLWEDGLTTFTWTNGSDNETPIAALSYNLGIGTSSEAQDILFPESDTDGSRLIQNLGNAQNNNEKLIVSLEDGIYFFKVQTIDGALSGSEFSEVVKFTVGTPTAPADVQASLLNNDVNITWTDNSINEFYFIIEQKSNLSADYIEIGSVTTNETSFSVSSLEDAIYTFRIKATNPNGESEYIETVNVVIGIPSAPSDALTSLDSNNDVIITWIDNSVNEFYFIIEQKSNLSEDYIEVGSVTTDETSFTVTSLEDAIYTFRIKATNPNGETPYIETVNIAIGIPSAPSEAQASLDSNNDVIITWTDNSVNEYSFIIEQKSNLNTDYEEIGTVTTDETLFKVSSLEDAIYTFRIMATNPNGDSEYIETDIALGIPSAPSNFIAKLMEQDITLTWNDLVNERNYKLERSSNDGQSFEELATLDIDAVNYLDENLEPGTYNYRIQAINENGESGFVNSDLVIEIVLAVGDFSEQSLSVYPNPVLNDYMYVEVPDNYNSYSITISDLSGRILNPPMTISKGSWRINTTTIKSGLYIIKLEKNGKIVSRIIMIE